VVGQGPHVVNMGRGSQTFGLGEGAPTPAFGWGALLSSPKDGGRRGEVSQAPFYFSAVDNSLNVPPEK